jgi:hypothetical protein
MTKMKTETQLRRALVKELNETGWMSARGHYYFSNGEFVSRFGWARIKKGEIQIRLHSSEKWVTPSGLWQIDNDQGQCIAKA